MPFPGHAGEPNLRAPFAVVMKRRVVSPSTFDDLLAAFAWSMKWLALGCFPPCRHDGSPFRTDEKHRSDLAGQDLKVRSVLVEVRGDWARVKQIFRLPGWHGAAGSPCCFRCTATHETRHLRAPNYGHCWLTRVLF